MVVIAAIGTCQNDAKAAAFWALPATIGPLFGTARNRAWLKLFFGISWAVFKICIFMLVDIFFYLRSCETFALRLKFCLFTFLVLFDVRYSRFANAVF